MKLTRGNCLLPVSQRDCRAVWNRREPILTSVPSSGGVTICNKIHIAACKQFSFSNTQSKHLTSAHLISIRKRKTAATTKILSIQKHANRLHLLSRFLSLSPFSFSLFCLTVSIWRLECCRTAIQPRIPSPPCRLFVKHGCLTNSAYHEAHCATVRP